MTKRLQKELKEFIDEPKELCKAELAKDDSLYEWRAEIIGPDKSPFESGVFKLEISIPTDYPFKPPKVKFATKIYHPNVKSRCLCQRWQPLWMEGRNHWTRQKPIRKWCIQTGNFNPNRLSIQTTKGEVCNQDLPSQCEVWWQLLHRHLDHWGMESSVKDPTSSHDNISITFGAKSRQSPGSWNCATV